jgi:hypothetical protein
MMHRPLDLVSATCRIEVNAIVALLQPSTVFPSSEDDPSNGCLRSLLYCCEVYRSGERNPALPARNTINVDGKNLTLRQVCSLVEHVTRPLPDSVVSDLFTSLCERHPRLEKRLVIDRTYALGARQKFSLPVT